MNDNDRMKAEQKEKGQGASMTALVSAFARAYHSKNVAITVFNDELAGELIKNEYPFIADQMSQGIQFFNPGFTGTKEEGLRCIVDNYLAPSPLCRAAFTQRQFEAAKMRGVKQYVVFAAGYDTTAYREDNSSVKFFEIDRAEMIEDKKARLATEHVSADNVFYIPADFNDEDWTASILECHSFEKDSPKFCSLLGLSYYLSAESFSNMISRISSLMIDGDSLVFDYPDEKTYTSEAGIRAQKQVMLAGGANESMLGSYSYSDMESLLSIYGLKIYEHLTPSEITDQYLYEYNLANPEHPMSAFDNVNYVLAVKK